MPASPVSSTEIGGTATADRLYRNIQQLQTGDREFIEDWIKSKANHARDKQRKPDK
jgi:hypothetical protein